MGKEMSKDGETREGIAQEALIKLLVKKELLMEEELLEKITKVKNKKPNPFDVGLRVHVE